VFWTYLIGILISAFILGLKQALGLSALLGWLLFAGEVISKSDILSFLFAIGGELKVSQ